VDELQEAVQDNILKRRVSLFADERIGTGGADSYLGYKSHIVHSATLTPRERTGRWRVASWLLVIRSGKLGHGRHWVQNMEPPHLRHINDCTAS